MPTVSVVVPCFNYGEHVRGCVKSLLDNTVDLEIIVIDDASTDDSWEDVRRLVKLDPRIKVIRGETNRGLIATANAGITMATGDYVVLLSADDALAPGWLDLGVAQLEANPGATFTYGPVRTFATVVPTLYLRRPARSQTVPGAEWIRQSATAGVTPIRSPEVIVRMSAQRVAGDYNAVVPYSSDMEMWLRLAALGDVIETQGPLAAFYRVQTVSMSRGAHMHSLRELQTRLRAFLEWRDSVGDRVPDMEHLLGIARRALAKAAVRRAVYALVREAGDAEDSMFEGLCEFALECDPAWAGPRVKRLRRLSGNDFAQSVGVRVRPLAEWVARARQVVPGIRARMPFA